MSGQKLSLFLAVGFTVYGGGADAAPQTVGADAVPQDVVVTADRVGLLERRANDTVLGLSKPLIETPRSASFVSAGTLGRYGILTLDKLSAVSPGTSLVVKS